jgi:hypothetical protein
MQSRKTHWSSILIFSVLGVGAMGFISIAAISSIVSVTRLIEDNAEAAGNMTFALASFIETIIVILCAWFVLQKTMGKESAEASSRIPFGVLPVVIIPFIVFLLASIGGLTVFTSINILSWLVLPVISIFVIILPILFFIGLGAKNIELGPRWRTFGVFGLGLTLGPFTMILLEVGILLFALVGLVIYLAFNPEQAVAMQEFANLLNMQSSEEAVQEMLLPYLTNPMLITSALVYISLLVPLIEELLKPLAVWLFAKNIDKPSQGFALGLLSGGAFALLESLNASADSSPTWIVVVLARIGTSLLHISTTGLMGYAIVAAFQKKKIMRLFAIYILVVLMHGLWNASAVAAGFSALGIEIGKPQWMFTIFPSAIAGLLILIIGMFIVLIASNRKVIMEEQLPSVETIKEIQETEKE